MWKDPGTKEVVENWGNGEKFSVNWAWRTWKELSWREAEGATYDLMEEGLIVGLGLNPNWYRINRNLNGWIIWS